MRSREFAQAVAEWGSTSQPASPTISGMQEAELLMTGVPAWNASTKGMPKPSKKLGKHKASAAPSKDCRASDLALPGNTTEDRCWVFFRALSKAGSACRESPTSTNSWLEPFFSLNRSKASSSRARFFRGVKEPTAKKYGRPLVQRARAECAFSGDMGAKARCGALYAVWSWDSG